LFSRTCALPRAGASEIMQPLEVVLPIAFVVLAFILKLFVDRTLTRDEFILSVIELPYDLSAQATVFIIAFTIAPNHDVTKGLLLFILYLGLLLALLVIFRRSRRLFDRSGPNYRLFLLTFSDFFLSITALIYSIGLVMGGS